MRPALWACLLIALTGAPLVASEPDYFPLQKGNFWIYEGDVSWLAPNPATNQNEVQHKHITWQSEVVDVVKTEDYVVALLHGFPTDLTWYNDKTKPSERLLILLGTDYFEIDDHPAEIFQKIKGAASGSSELYKLVDHAELFLSTPLA